MAHDTDVAADSPRTTPPASLNTETTKVEKSSAISSPTGGFSDGDKNPSDLNLAAASAQNGPDVAIPPAAHEPPELSKKSKTIIVSALCLCVFLSALDQTIITTAIPVLAGEFNSPSAYTWIGSAYLLGSAALLPSWGKFSDIWGRKPVLLSAAVLFMIGSILCAASTNIALMLTGRVIQGIGAGGQLGLVNVTIADIISIRERGLYLSFIGMTWAFASAIGPVLGGVFTGMAPWGWRFCFIINIPTGLAAMTAIQIFLHLQSPKITIREGLKRIDWAGTFLIISGTLLFLIGLEFGGVQHPWNSPIIISFLTIGLLLLAAFLLVEWKHATSPIIPLRLFHNRTNIAAYTMALAHGIVFLGGCYFLPFYFQSVRGDTPLLSGVYVLPFVLPLSLASGATGVIIAKTGRYQEVIWCGCAVMLLGTGLLLDLDRTSNWGKLAMYQALAGAGAGPLFQGPLIAIHSTIAAKDIGTATTTFAFLRTLGTSLAISIGMVVFSNQMQAQIPELAKTLRPDVLAMITGKEASASVERVKTLPERERWIAQDAYGEGVHAMWFFFFGCAAVCAVAAAGLGKHHLSKKVESSQPAVDRKDRKRKDEGLEGEKVAAEV